MSNLLNMGAQGIQYSPVDINALGSASQSLIGIGVDESGSMSGDGVKVQEMLKDVSKANAKSKYAGSIITRTTGISTVHNGHDREIHGFTPALSLSTAAYGSVIANGGTPLYDGAYNLLWSLYDQGGLLNKQEINVNAVAVFITDGGDNAGNQKHSGRDVADLIRRMRTELNGAGMPIFDSVKLLVIGINATNCAADLRNWVSSIGLNPSEDYIDAGDMSPTKYGRMMGLLTQTISQTAANLGTGTPSQINAAQAANILQLGTP